MAELARVAALGGVKGTTRYNSSFQHSKMILLNIRHGRKEQARADEV